LSSFLPACWLVTTIAIAAVNRAACARFKRNLSLFSALGANSRIHLSLHTGFTSAETLFFGGTAGGAALGLIGKALLGVKLLLSGGEGERSLAIRTGKGLVREAQG
jgi:hypothetical protein